MTMNPIWTDAKKPPEPKELPIEFAGFTFLPSEIKSITVERGGRRVYIEEKVPERKMGF